MKTLIILFSISILTFANNEIDKKLSYILNKFSEKSKIIYKLEYNIQRIDTFSRGTIWNNNGYALIEKDTIDSQYGFVFLGENYSLNQVSIYDGKTNYLIDKNKKSYKIVKSVKGSPGYQMLDRITELIFRPILTYSNVSLMIDTSKSYFVKYEFNDELVLTNIQRIIELDKKTFFPISFEMSSYSFGRKSSLHIILSDFKINSDVKNSIEKSKEILNTYTLKIPKEKKVRKNLVNSKAPNFLLPELLNSESMVQVYNKKVTLLDFWSSSCGPCIASMPKIEKISKKYSNQLDVIGIVTSGPKTAKKFVAKFGITFNSLVGNKYVLEKYDVTAIPRYFLIDNNGIIVKDYLGFSTQIEKDIEQLLKE